MMVRVAAYLGRKKGPQDPYRAMGATSGNHGTMNVMLTRFCLLRQKVFSWAVG